MSETPEQTERRRSRQRRNSAAYRARHAERARESRRRCDTKRRRSQGAKPRVSKPRGPYKARAPKPAAPVVLNARMLAVKARLLAMRRGEA